MPSNMSDAKHENREEDSRRGPSLALIYSLLGAAILAAMTIAALIVLPFYRRH